MSTESVALSLCAAGWPAIADDVRAGAAHYLSCVCRKRRPFDLVEESRSVGQDGRAAFLPFEAVGFAVQADRPA